MTALAEVGRRDLRDARPGPVLERIAERALVLLAADTSAVFLAEDDGAVFRPFVALGSFADAVLGDTIQLGEGIIGDMARRGQAEVVNDVAGDAADRRRSPGTEGDDIEYRLMAAPLRSHGEVIGDDGGLAVGAGRAVHRRATWRSSSASSQQAAIAIQNARLFEEGRAAQEAAEQAEPGQVARSSPR